MRKVTTIALKRGLRILLALALAMGVLLVTAAGAYAGTTEHGFDESEKTYGISYYSNNNIKGAPCYGMGSGMVAGNEKLSAVKIASAQELAERWPGYANYGEKYDDAFFDDHILVFFNWFEGNSGRTHQIRSVRDNGDSIDIELSTVRFPYYNLTVATPWCAAIEMGRESLGKEINVSSIISTAERYIGNIEYSRGMGSIPIPIPPPYAEIIRSTKELADRFPNGDELLAKYDEEYFGKKEMTLLVVNWVEPYLAFLRQVSLFRDNGDSIEVELSSLHPDNSDVAVPAIVSRWHAVIEMDRRLADKPISVTPVTGDVLEFGRPYMVLQQFQSSFSVTVTTNTTWGTPTSDQPWLTISEVSPASRAGNGSFTVTAEANTERSIRSGIITVTGGGVTRTILVSQMEAMSTMTVSPDTWSPTSSASETVISIASNKTWNMPTSNQPWLTISNVTPANRTGNGSFTVSAAANTATAPRTGIVTVTDSGITRTISVTQAGMPGQVATPAATPNGGSFTSFRNVTLSSATAGASIFYTTDGTTPSTDSKLYSGYMTLDSTTTINALAVKEGMEDSDILTVTFTFIPELNEIEKTYSIRYHQGSSVGSGIVYNDPSTHYGSTVKIQSIDELSEYFPRRKELEFFEKYDESFFLNRFLVCMSWLERHAARTHRVTSVHAEGETLEIELSRFSPDGMSATIFTPWSAFLEIERELAVGMETWLPAHSASSTTVSVTSNITWGTQTSDQPWLTVTNVTPANRTGNGSFTVSAAANTATAPRTGAVTVTGGGITRTISVTQEAAPANAITLDPGRQTETINVSAGAGGRVRITNPTSEAVTITSTGSNPIPATDPALFNAEGTMIAYNNAGAWNFTYTLSPGETVYAGTWGSVARTYVISVAWPTVAQGITLDPSRTTETVIVTTGAAGRVQITNPTSGTVTITSTGNNPVQSTDPALFNAAGTMIAYNNASLWNFTYTLSPGETVYAGTWGGVARTYVVSVTWPS